MNKFKKDWKPDSLGHLGCEGCKKCKMVKYRYLVNYHNKSDRLAKGEVCLDCGKVRKEGIIKIELGLFDYRQDMDWNCRNRIRKTYVSCSKCNPFIKSVNDEWLEKGIPQYDECGHLCIARFCSECFERGRNMNKKNLIDWEKWGKENQKEVSATKLKNTKSGSISYLESQGNYASRKEIFHAHWETYLISSDYWKNWREKINSFQTTQEVNFYTDRLRAFIEFAEKYTCKDINNYCGSSIEGLQQWDPLKTPQLIDQELKRLENISEEEFNKTDKWRKSGPIWKKLSAKEMLNDPWFNEQINSIFGLESKENKEKGEKKNLSVGEQNNPETPEKNDKPVPNYSSLSHSNSSDQNDNHFGIIILTVSLLALASLVVYGIVSRIRKGKNR